MRITQQVKAFPPQTDATPASEKQVSTDGKRIALAVVIVAASLVAAYIPYLLFSL